MKKFAALGLAATAVLAAPAHAALEALVPYDGFDNADVSIDPNLWTPTYGAVEQARYIEDNGMLRIAQRVLARNSANTGTTYNSYGLGFYDPASIREIAVSITIEGIGSTACAANTETGFSAARVAGSFFNYGGKTSGSQVNDVIAQIRVERQASSTAAEHVTNVVARVDKCANADCSQTTNLYTNVLRSNLPRATATRVYMRWDQAAKTFNFKEGSNTNQKYVYTMKDTVAPSQLFRVLQARNKVENCTTGARDGYVNAMFDNVYVNTSGDRAPSL